MAFSSTMGARAKFRITPFLRMSLRRASLTRPRVSGVSGTCTEITSERTNRSSSDRACSTLEDSCQARCTVICGSYPRTFMPSASAELATSTPIAPRPTTPSVRPGSSKPTNFFLPFSTASSIAWSSPDWDLANDQAWVMLRAARNMPASTSSFTALALAPGALNTGMPFFDRASTGMLLVPAPARPTARRLSGSASLCMSAERTRMASGPLMSDATSKRSRGRRSRPLMLMLLSVWILNRIVFTPCAGVIACALTPSTFLPAAVVMGTFLVSWQTGTHLKQVLPRLPASRGKRGKSPSGGLRLEFLHELDQCIDAFGRHRVVDGRAHAAHGAMTLEIHEAGLLGFVAEGLVELGLGQCERHVHPRA